MVDPVSGGSGQFLYLGYSGALAVAGDNGSNAGNAQVGQSSAVNASKTAGVQPGECET